MTRRLFLPAFSVLLFAALVFPAEAPPDVRAESVGLSSERLKHLRATMQQYVDEGRVAGLVTYIARSGRVAHLEAFGKADIEAGIAMKTDSIFRIASQTKALTSVAVVMLVEEGKIGSRRPGLAVHPGVQEDDGGGSAAGGRGARDTGERGAREARDHHP